MKCPVCKGTLKRGNTKFPVEIGEGLLFVKNVPAADVCPQCGEGFIPDEIAESLEKIIAKAKQKNVELEIVSYEKAA
ncbi:MAG: type II toxin-antitoxin system MqsA family antitoxin [Nitrospiria bacterium]